VRVNAAGTASMACEECDVSLFAKKGTDAHRRLTEGMGTKPAPEPAPTPPAPTGKAPRSAFAMGGL